MSQILNHSTHLVEPLLIKYTIQSINSGSELCRIPTYSILNLERTVWHLLTGFRVLYPTGRRIWNTPEGWSHVSPINILIKIPRPFDNFIGNFMVSYNDRTTIIVSPTMVVTPVPLYTNALYSNLLLYFLLFTCD